MIAIPADDKKTLFPPKGGPAERHVVLVAPEVHWNTGNIGRTCLGAGACLHLIRPLGHIQPRRKQHPYHQTESDDQILPVGDTVVRTC